MITIIIRIIITTIVVIIKVIILMIMIIIDLLLGLGVEPLSRSRFFCLAPIGQHKESTGYYM